MTSMAELPSGWIQNHVLWTKPISFSADRHREACQVYLLWGLC